MSGHIVVSAVRIAIQSWYHEECRRNKRKVWAGSAFSGDFLYLLQRVSHVYGEIIITGHVDHDCPFVLSHRSSPFRLLGGVGLIGNP